MATDKHSVSFNCFSPPVMLATLIIEIVLAAYTALRYKLNPLGRLTVITVLALAAFQLCEYYVCTSKGVNASGWSRAGFVAISLLPPLGLNILHILADRPGRKLVAAAYTTMAGFVGYFLLTPHVFDGYACTGNYVIFQIGNHATLAYTVYYYGWIAMGIALGVRWAYAFWAQGQAMRARNLAVQALILGYLVFLVPTALVNTIKPETVSGIPSIMCGFAVMLALILTLYIVPKVGVKRTSK